MQPEFYDEDYYLRGRQSGKSLYENYRWLEELTVPMALAITAHLGLRLRHTVCDFGCARGYLVKALRKLGYRAFGLDHSAWAVENCDPAVRGFVRRSSTAAPCDWVIAKDVLEHVPEVQACVDDLMANASAGVFAVVPLSAEDGGEYVVPEYEKDVTHVHRLTLPAWVKMFLRPGWSVEMAYRVPGVKDNYADFERGNGFITARRIRGVTKGGT